MRDLMMGRTPKDFDIGTNAKPNEIRRLFSNSRIIGRRFRLVHVFFHDGGIVEVSTFRRDPDPEEQRGEPGELLITSDNTYGTPRQDAFRRDFTVNALFYSVADYSVIDHVGGIEDLERKLIRAIGDPELRFREDPVRMLRACEFAGRLGVGIETKTQEAIHRHSRELEKASPARVTEEIIQLMKCGRAGAAMQWMLELDLLQVLLPEAYAMLSAGARGLGDFGQILPVIDRMVAARPAALGHRPARRPPAPQGHAPPPRHRVVAGGNRQPMTRAGRSRSMIEEEIAPFFPRLTLSNLRAQQVYHALLGFQRLCEPHGLEPRAAEARPQALLRRRPAPLRDPRPGDGGGGRGARRLAGRGPPPAPAQGARRERGGRQRPRRRRRRRPRLVTSFTKSAAPDVGSA